MNVQTHIKKEEFISFLLELGIDIKTNTKARGHQGIFVKGRIDVSKMLDEKRQIQVMAHEFAHYIHSKTEPDINITKGHLQNIFKTENITQIEKELKQLTLNIDENAKLKNLKNLKADLIQKINIQENIIKAEYPNFQRSKKFAEFEQSIKKSDARFLLKYDKIKLITPFLRREKFYTIDTIERDFPNLKPPFYAYIRMISLQKKQRRLSAKINKYNKYYNSHAELFARFIESFFIDKNIPPKIAPTAYIKFFELLQNGHYKELKQLFCISGLYN